MADPKVHGGIVPVRNPDPEWAENYQGIQSDTVRLVAEQMAGPVRYTQHAHDLEVARIERDLRFALTSLGLSFVRRRP
jgi:hypothetical protein